ncbi:hypothetical protein [Photobacterium leiognathi]|uniref:hypothetical protein n=1 Tax=Photobacterium leiognathi TaxID=553611 RepID=UPI00298150D7|nr:hypothetical protein [Photobacterium leiognathi]
MNFDYLYYLKSWFYEDCESEFNKVFVEPKSVFINEDGDIKINVQIFSCFSNDGLKTSVFDKEIDLAKHGEKLILSCDLDFTRSEPDFSFFKTTGSVVSHSNSNVLISSDVFNSVFEYDNEEPIIELKRSNRENKSVFYNSCLDGIGRIFQIDFPESFSEFLLDYVLAVQKLPSAVKYRFDFALELHHLFKDDTYSSDLKYELIFNELFEGHIGKSIQNSIDDSGFHPSILSGRLVDVGSTSLKWKRFRKALKWFSLEKYGHPFNFNDAFRCTYLPSKFDLTLVNRKEYLRSVRLMPLVMPSLLVLSDAIIKGNKSYTRDLKGALSWFDVSERKGLFNSFLSLDLQNYKFLDDAVLMFKDYAITLIIEAIVNDPDVRGEFIPVSSHGDIQAPGFGLISKNNISKSIFAINNCQIKRTINELSLSCQLKMISRIHNSYTKVVTEGYIDSNKSPIYFEPIVDLPIGFRENIELINNSLDLALLGKGLNNCVFTRLKELRNNNTLIAKISTESGDSCLEIRKNKEGKIVTEHLAFDNSTPSPEHEEIANNFFDAIKNTINFENSNNMQDDKVSFSDCASHLVIPAQNKAFIRIYSHLVSLLPSHVSIHQMIMCSVDASHHELLKKTSLIDIMPLLEADLKVSRDNRTKEGHDLLFTKYFEPPRRLLDCSDSSNEFSDIVCSNSNKIN